MPGLTGAAREAKMESMELILLRHGKTPSTEECGVRSDFDRSLGEQGKEQAKRAGKALVEMGLVPSRVLASPVTRARQTAERAVKGLGKDVPLEIKSWLEAGAEPEEILKNLAAYKDETPLLLVGHQPDLGNLAGLLVSGPQSSGIDLKPGGMLLLEIDDLAARGTAALRWLLLPSQIENLG